MNEHLLVVRESLSGIAPPLITGLIGAISYGLTCGIRRGFHNINEKEFLLIITEFAALVPALKIIILSFDHKITRRQLFRSPLPDHSRRTNHTGYR